MRWGKENQSTKTSQDTTPTPITETDSCMACRLWLEKEGVERGSQSIPQSKGHIWSGTCVMAALLTRQAKEDGMRIAKEVGIREEVANVAWEMLMPEWEETELETTPRMPSQSTSTDKNTMEDKEEKRAKILQGHKAGLCYVGLWENKKVQKARELLSLRTGKEADTCMNIVLTWATIKAESAYQISLNLIKYREDGVTHGHEIEGTEKIPWMEYTKNQADITDLSERLQRIAQLYAPTQVATGRDKHRLEAKKAAMAWWATKEGYTIRTAEHTVPCLTGSKAAEWRKTLKDTNSWLCYPDYMTKTTWYKAIRTARLKLPLSSERDNTKKRSRTPSFIF